MLVLAINTASSITAIAIIKNGRILAEKSWTSKNSEAEKLLPAISHLLKNLKPRFKDVKCVYVVRGPGSFTGLRVGITTANTIVYLNNTELFSINTFEYWHQASQLPVTVYAGSGGVYFSKNAKSKPLFFELKAFNQFLKNKKILQITGDISVEQKAAINSAKFIPVKKSFGEIILKIIQSKKAQIHTGKYKIVEPLYIKEPGITTPKKR